jgi:2-keto-3-deoxy-L-rhamnonate aldolase RhmA
VIPTPDLRALLESRPVVGTFLKLPRAEVVAILAAAGFDFVICDLEHAQIDDHECREVLLAARAEGLPVVVRVPGLDRGVINRVLEGGAAGIQLPRTRTRADSSALSDLMRYPPLGSRSVSQAQPAAGYGREPLVDYLGRSNATVLRIGQFETADITAPLDDAVADLDVAFIGSLDLSVDCGTPGDVGSPEVRRRIEVVEEAARRAGTALGMFAGTVTAAQDALDAGYRYVAVAADLTLLSRGATELVRSLRGADS